MPQSSQPSPSSVRVFVGQPSWNSNVLVVAAPRNPIGSRFRLFMVTIGADEGGASITRLPFLADPFRHDDDPFSVDVSMTPVMRSMLMSHPVTTPYIPSRFHDTAHILCSALSQNLKYPDSRSSASQLRRALASVSSYFSPYRVDATEWCEVEPRILAADTMHGVSIMSAYRSGDMPRVHSRTNQLALLRRTGPTRVSGSFQTLGAAVAAAHRESLRSPTTWDSLDDVMASFRAYEAATGFDPDNERDNSTLTRINNVLRGLSTGSGTPVIVHSDCGHFELLPRQMYLRTNWNDPAPSFCRHCGATRLRVPQDDSAPWDVNALYFHSDRVYRTYEEFDEPVDDQDEYDEDSTVSHPVKGVVAYNYNVMSYLRVDRERCPAPSPFTDFHMGLELETEERDGDNLHAKCRSVCRELAGLHGAPYCVGKVDGSLGERGIEFVTRPTVLSEHIRVLGEWTFSRGGLRAWDAGNCGMHVHITSSAFNKSTLGKLLQFFNRHDNSRFIRGIAGRHPLHDEQARHYANMDVDDRIANRGVMPTLRSKAENASRYRMINLTNLTTHEAARLGVDGTTDRSSRSASTVEIRIFRASLKRERLLSQIEFAHAIVCFCRATSLRKLSGSDFVAWLRSNGLQYPNLRRWLRITQPRPIPAGKVVPRRPTSRDETYDIPEVIA